MISNLMGGILSASFYNVFIICITHIDSTKQKRREKENSGHNQQQKQCAVIENN